MSWLAKKNVFYKDKGQRCWFGRKEEEGGWEEGGGGGGEEEKEEQRFIGRKQAGQEVLREREGEEVAKASTQACLPQGALAYPAQRSAQKETKRKHLLQQEGREKGEDKRENLYTSWCVLLWL